jgi:hypothetical protein
MTVCVGALAAKSKAIVMVADKAVTYPQGGSAEMQWDTSVKKILPIGPFGWRALVAGEVSFAEEVIHNTCELLVSTPDDARSHWRMMERVKEAYRSARDTHAEDRFVKPRLLTRELVFSRSKDLQPLDSELLHAVKAEIENFQVDCHLLVCGFDEHNQPHIFLVEDPGEGYSYDPFGFHAIGVGAGVAIGKLLWEEASRDDALEEMLYKAFEAKANAEIVSGVGYEWDAEIITGGNKAVSVPDKIHKIIEQLFSTHGAGPFGSVADEDIPPRTWKAALRKYAESVLTPETAAVALE